MTGHATDTFRREHEQLLEHVEHIRRLAREVDDLSLEERAERVERILGFVSGTLLPHAEAEEGVLAAYLAEKELLGEGGDGWQRLQRVYRGADREAYFADLRRFLRKTGYAD